ncbi:MAG: hypothetical protein COU51_02365 [Parcubacteria group bacterium CG10_big_fil_rev_8_21_14_0_10_36_14]|nr:MAG: hypothetical protein COU51_02365 [Parcubacteria group bacterium CG10_big_fil_rev_8_21_14_0_10_36_14]
MFADTAREPFVILDRSLVVVGANKAFYETFKTSKNETEGKLIYELGSNQWNIDALKKLLEDILPKKKSFNDYEVIHNFPNIGQRIMLLNDRQLDSTKQILVSMEDATAKRVARLTLENYTKNLEKTVASKTKNLTAHIDELNKINKLMTGRELKMIELKDEVTISKSDQSPKK